MPMQDFIPEGQDDAYESGQYQDFVPEKVPGKIVTNLNPEPETNPEPGVEVIVPKGGKPAAKTVTVTQAKQLGAK